MQYNTLRHYLILMLMLLLYTVIIVRIRTQFEVPGDLDFSPILVPVSVRVEHNNSLLRVNTSRFIIPNPLGQKKTILLVRKRIVFYRPFHGGLKNQMQNLKMATCQYKNCDVHFTGLTSGLVNAHAVLFQGNHIPMVIPRRRNSNQVFVFINIEAPQYLHYTNLASPKWRNFFNWTMTYRLDSDIPYPYGSIVVHPDFSEPFGDLSSLMKSADGNVKLQMDMVNRELQNITLSGRPGKAYRSIFRRKSKSAAWLVSHCVTASKREKYVDLMKPHMSIDIFGQCSHRVCKRGSVECKESIIRDYFFYFSFENSLCRDYVTEKEYEWFNEDIITVVRGARTYKKYLPTGTYIDADDFQSPKHLARFLDELSKDEDRYIAYLKRKDHFLAIDMRVLTQNAYCELCKRLNHLEKYRKSTKDIRAWWTKNVCTQPFDIYRPS